MLPRPLPMMPQISLCWIVIWARWDPELHFKVTSLVCGDRLTFRAAQTGSFRAQLKEALQAQCWSPQTSQCIPPYSCSCGNGPVYHPRQNGWDWRFRCRPDGGRVRRVHHWSELRLRPGCGGGEEQYLSWGAAQGMVTPGGRGARQQVSTQTLIKYVVLFTCRVFLGFRLLKILQGIWDSFSPFFSLCWLFILKTNTGEPFSFLSLCFLFLPPDSVCSSFISKHEGKKRNVLRNFSIKMLRLLSWVTHGWPRPLEVLAHILTVLPSTNFVPIARKIKYHLSRRCQNIGCAMIMACIHVQSSVRK